MPKSNFRDLAMQPRGEQCPTGKLAYADEDDAVTAERSANRRPDAPTQYRYACPICKYWHLTSVGQTRKQKTRTRRIGARPRRDDGLAAFCDITLMLLILSPAFMAIIGSWL